MVPQPDCYSSLLFLYPLPCFLPVQSLGFSFIFGRRKKNRPQLVTITKNGVLFSIWDFDGRIAYEDIVKATEDFDIKYCIGVGGYGSVYRAGLPSRKTVALKKLHIWESNDPMIVLCQSFIGTHEPTKFFWIAILKLLYLTLALQDY